jgi:homoserine O-succinyltransferase
MPVIVTSQEIHPFLPSLGSGAAIDRERAEHQDIRPLEIVILNLMADKLATERQLAQWLGNTMLQVRLTFAATDSYVREIGAGRASKNTSPDHVLKFYSAWSDIKEQKFDGLIVTGVNALQPRVSDEAIWGEVQQILDWSQTHVLSSLFLCWGAKAALKHFHNIESSKGAQKTFGLFDHRIVKDSTDLLSGFPDVFPVPVARWKSPDAAAIAACKDIEIVALSDEIGPNIMVETAAFDRDRLYPRRVYVLNHPEYETDTLATEYHRDHNKDPSTPLPRHYFPDNDPSKPPLNTWRHTAHLYTNWVKTLYEATPYRLHDVPAPFRR